MPDLSSKIPRLTRRDLFRLGALSVAGFELAPMLAPPRLRAEGRDTPRGSVDSVILLNLRGGPSQMDTFDAKVGSWTDEEFGIAQARQGFLWPHGLLPKLGERLDRLCLLRSMEAWDTVHSRAQHYLQTGHQSSPARNEEMPSLGAIVAYETQDRRRSTDFLPPYVSMNYTASTMYGPQAKQGCLPGEYAPLTLDLARDKQPFVLEEADRPAFERRWDLLAKLDGRRVHPRASERQNIEREFAAYAESVRRMMLNPGLRDVMTLDDADRKRYGSTPFGDACVLARNMVQADAGVRFVMATHDGWDHHGNIHPGLKKLGPQLDAAFSALLDDLAAHKKPDGSTQLDRTLILCLGEFGRTPGELTINKGREHYAEAMCAAVAGGGTVGGRALGATDELASKVVDPGWSEGRPIYVEDVFVTIYSALGIDWNKRIVDTPSGRDFVYVDPAAGKGYFRFREIGEIY